MRRMWSKKQIEEFALNIVQSRPILVLEDSLEVDGNLQVLGNAEIFENIVDSDGHERFINGDIGIVPAVEDKIEDVYTKWTLSGSHLMLVFMFKVKENFTAADTHCGTAIVPSWLGDKIYPMGETNHIAVIDSTYGYLPSNLSASVGTIRTYMNKNVNNLYLILESGNLEADKYYRIVFDLVIE